MINAWIRPMTAKTSEFPPKISDKIKIKRWCQGLNTRPHSPIYIWNYFQQLHPSKCPFIPLPIIMFDYLYIMGLKECTCSPKDKAIPLNKIFPNIQGDSVKAVWFSGEIRVPLGKPKICAFGLYVDLWARPLFNI